MAFPNRHTLGLALGSGAARGMAHIGVLKVLEEHHITIDRISGTSIGALIGGLYAARVPIAQIEEVACGADWRDLTRLVDPIFPTSGIIDGKKVARFIAELLPVRRFEELHIPLAITATDVESGEPLYIHQGNLLEGLRAAIAFPGIFTPVRFGDRFLVDGGLCNPVPVDILRELGAERVIGVCAIPDLRPQCFETVLSPEAFDKPVKGSLRNLFTVEGFERRFRDLWSGADLEPKGSVENSVNGRKPPGIFKIFAQSIAIMENQINELRLAQNHIDLLLRPQFPGLNLFEFHRAEEAIRAGEEVTRTHLDEIRALARID